VSNELTPEQIQNQIDELKKQLPTEENWKRYVQLLKNRKKDAEVNEGKVTYIITKYVGEKLDGTIKLEFDKNFIDDKNIKNCDNEKNIFNDKIIKEVGYICDLIQSKKSKSSDNNYNPDWFDEIMEEYKEMNNQEMKGGNTR